MTQIKMFAEDSMEKLELAMNEWMRNTGGDIKAKNVKVRSHKDTHLTRAGEVEQYSEVTIFYGFIIYEI